MENLSIDLPDNSYDPAYFEPLFKAEEKHFWFRARNKVIGSITRGLLKAGKGPYRILEIGCGTGNVLREWAGLKPLPDLVCGMDLFAEGLFIANKRVSCSLVQGDVELPPFKHVFNLVGLFDVLEHIPDDQGVLNSLGAMLVEDGAILLTVPAFPSLWSYFDVASHHVRRYLLQDLRAKVTAAGFTVEFASYYMMTIFPVVWLQRKLAGSSQLNHAADKPDAIRSLALDELKIIPGINGVLNFILSLEAKWIQRYRKLPFGTSIVLVARKNRGK